jgi:hypothetical protein
LSIILAAPTHTKIIIKKKVALRKWHQLLEVNARLPRQKKKKKAALSNKLLEATVQLGKVKFSS